MACHIQQIYMPCPIRFPSQSCLSSSNYSTYESFFLANLKGKYKLEWWIWSIFKKLMMFNDSEVFRLSSVTPEKLQWKSGWALKYYWKYYSLALWLGGFLACGRQHKHSLSLSCDSILAFFEDSDVWRKDEFDSTCILAVTVYQPPARQLSGPGCKKHGVSHNITNLQHCKSLWMPTPMHNTFQTTEKYYVL